MIVKVTKASPITKLFRMSSVVPISVYDQMRRCYSDLAFEGKSAEGDAMVDRRALHLSK